jgi:hypothetical protein
MDRKTPFIRLAVENDIKRCWYRIVEAARISLPNRQAAHLDKSLQRANASTTRKIGIYQTLAANPEIWLTNYYN